MFLFCLLTFYFRLVDLYREGEKVGHIRGGGSNTHLREKKRKGNVISTLSLST